MTDRRDRLSAAHLYMVCDARSDAFLDAALRGGVDIVQLRCKDADDESLLACADRFAKLCARHRALFILNDRPDLVAEVGADGVHVGQDDASVSQARQYVGPQRLVGLSTHNPGQITAANQSDLDYIGVGPVHRTPTKPGRPAVGLGLVRHAADHARMPFFAIGGITRENVDAVAGAGARRVAVVRALTEAADVDGVARALRRAVTAERIGVARP